MMLQPGSVQGSSSSGPSTCGQCPPTTAMMFQPGSVQGSSPCGPSTCGQCSPATAMTLQPGSIQGSSPSGPSTCGQCPPSTSMLPSLTRQALTTGVDRGQSVAGNSAPASVLAAGCMCSQTKGENLESKGGLRDDFDLGNGWKVVGLTSLDALTSIPSLQPQVLSIDGCDPAKLAARGREGSAAAEKDVQADAAPANGDLSSLGPYTRSGRKAPFGCPAPDPLAEWKIVGLTSLNSGNVGKTETGNTGPPPCSCSSLGGRENTWQVDNRGQNVSVPEAGVSVMETKRRSPGVKGDERAAAPSGDLCLPSLADLTSGESEWKIAGLTTLPTPAGQGAVVSGTAGGDEGADTGRVPGLDAAWTLPGAALPAPSPAFQWKVVGLTSLNTPSPQKPAPDVAPFVPSSPVALGLTSLSAPSPQKSPPTLASLVPSHPVALATTAPVVSRPASSAVGGWGDGWKVVGMVPLLQNEDSSLAALADCRVPVQAAPDPLSTQLGQNCGAPTLPTLLPRPPDATSQCAAADANCMKCCDKPQKASWVSTKLTRNAHNRKWTSCVAVPRTREEPGHPLAFLKNCSRQFRNTVLKKNTVSTMLELKRAFQTTQDDKKLLSLLARKKLISQKDQGIIFQKESSEDSDDSETSTGSPLTKPLQTSVDATSGARYDSCGSPLVPGTQPQVLLQVDDRLVLSNAYQAQVDSHRGWAMPTNSAPAPSCHTNQSQHTAHKQACTDFHGNNAHLTSMDPWGVCTSEDFGEIADMVTEKAGSRMIPSSSRKRKLTTPRKMVQ